MADINTVCETCSPKIAPIFDPPAATRQSQILAGDLLVSEQCFVRDEIRFLNSGRLIFVPHPLDKDGGRVAYFREYFVICRKLIIVGGNKPISVNPCGPDDPGQMYQGNNVITWQDRLKAAASGASPSPLAAPNGTSFDPNNWAAPGAPDGRTGSRGGDGTPGAEGQPGTDARTDTPSFTLVVFEVEAQVGDHLTIDFDGQDGGVGGRGQNGGNGGTGMAGHDGVTQDNSWPSGDECGSQPGNGGDGGNGGVGGRGGIGGKGGPAGNITILSTAANLASSPLVTGQISYVNDGGKGGIGGRGGIGGKGAPPGKPGFKTSECTNAATAGNPGLDGDPFGIANGPGSLDNQGPTGGPGSAGSFTADVLTPARCTENIPLPIVPFAVTSIVPSTGARGASVAVTITGTGFDNTAAIKTVTLSGVGVTASNVVVNATQTTVTCDLAIGAAAPLGARDVTVRTGALQGTLAASFTVTA